MEKIEGMEIVRTADVEKDEKELKKLEDGIEQLKNVLFQITALSSVGSDYAFQYEGGLAFDLKSSKMDEEDLISKARKIDTAFLYCREVFDIIAEMSDKIVKEF
jgi:hypothetical protein